PHRSALSLHDALPILTTRPKTWLLGIPVEICEMLLRTSPVGRLGVVVDGRPVVFPVCGVYVGGTIVFPTTPGTKLHAALTWPWVDRKSTRLTSSHEWI